MSTLTGSTVGVYTNWKYRWCLTGSIFGVCALTGRIVGVCALTGSIVGACTLTEV